MTLTPKQARRLALHKRHRDRSLAAASTPAIRASLAKSYHRTITKASTDCGDCDQGAPVGHYRCPVCSAAHEKKWGGYDSLL